MLEIEHRRARSREVEFGSDCPARRGQRGNPFCNPRPRFARYVTTGLARPTVYRRRRFPDRCTRADVELPASADEAHEALSGPATRRILEREVQLYGKQEYARLAAISVSSFEQPAQVSALPRAAFELRQDAAHGDLDRRTAQAAATGPARLSAHGYGVSGRSAGRECRSQARGGRASTTSTPSMKLRSGR